MLVIRPIKLMLFLLLMMVCGCEKNNVQSDNVTITLSQQLLEMKVGSIEMLQAKVSNGATAQWQSADTAVAIVIGGAVEAKRVGHTQIMASVGDVRTTCEVYVMSASGSTITLNTYARQLNKGESFLLQCYSTYGLPLTWTSSKPDCFSVSDEGLVTSLKAGSAIITASDGAQSVSATMWTDHVWGDYQLVWEENFNGTSLDLSVWNIETNGGGGGNQEKQYYTDRNTNVRVENGNLVLQLRKEDYKDRAYTSGRINSRGKKEFCYGRMEASISFPSGGGTWPAFWMLGSNYSDYGWPRCGEIDIIEHVGNQPLMASFALHTKIKNGSKGNNWSSRAYLDNLENNYHTYAVEWQQEAHNGLDRIIFYVDGVEYASQTEDPSHMDDDEYWPFFRKQYIILNLAVGGTMGGKIDDTMFDHDVLMKVDWVRVYQRQEVQ